ncbi:MAG: hypothetical protein WBE20_02325 [Candidatus Acidiferrales bacterium]
MPEDSKKPNPFQAAQPQIPGVSQPRAGKARKSGDAKGPSTPALGFLWACGGGAIVVIVIAIIFFARGSARAAHPVTPIEVPRTAARPAPLAPVEAVPIAPGPVATTEELAQPWAAKQFMYRTAVGDTMPAMVVHLTGNTYWAFSLRVPYGSCTLEYVTDPEKLLSDYGVRSSRPLLCDPCSHTVYDLAKYGSGPNGLVRGAVITGTGLRPPLAIEVQLNGHEILATRVEAQ